VQSLGYSGGGLSYTQSFGYDALNRLTTSSESGSAWSQTNAYDRYGNRQIDYGGGSYNLAFSATTNRITTSGHAYDAAGNLTNDTVHAYTRLLNERSRVGIAPGGTIFPHTIRKLAFLLLATIPHWWLCDCDLWMEIIFLDSMDTRRSLDLHKTVDIEPSSREMSSGM